MKLSASSTGRIAKTLDGHAAFVPAPLPPELAMSWGLMQKLAEAERAVGRLAGIGRLLPDPAILIQPFVRREAVLSSRIEGTQASFSDLVVFQATGAPDSATSDVLEVSNYIRALDHGMKRLPQLPLSLRFIRELHQILMTGVRGGMKMPGEFRTVQNWIGPHGSTIATATYVPPPVPEMREALHELERYFHAPTELPVLIRAALVHYQFEAIHPFLDGNGRIGRLLVMFLLHLENVLDQPLLYLSAFFERHRDDYYRLLLDVSMRGAWTEWIDFFLRGVIEQANDAVKRTRTLLDLSQRYRTKLAKSRNLARLSQVIDHLMLQPATTVREVAATLKISYPAAKKNVDKLVQSGIVVPFPARRGTVYLAHEIIGVME